MRRQNKVIIIGGIVFVLAIVFVYFNKTQKGEIAKEKAAIKETVIIENNLKNEKFTSCLDKYPKTLGDSWFQKGEVAITFRQEATNDYINNFFKKIDSKQKISDDVQTVDRSIQSRKRNDFGEGGVTLTLLIPDGKEIETMCKIIAMEEDLIYQVNLNVVSSVGI